MIMNLLTFTGFMMINPILAPYAINIGATLTIASLIAGSFAIMALIARPMAGLLVDRVNKKKLLHIVIALLMLTTFSYSLAPSYEYLLIVRIFHGLFFAVSSTAGTSLATVYIPKNKLGQGIGYLGITFILGSGLGPNLGSLIKENLNYQAVFITSGLLLAAATVLMFFLKNPAKPAEVANKEKRKIRLSDMVATELLFLTGLVACATVLNGMVGTYILLLADEKGIANISLFFTVSTVVLLITRPFTGYLIDRKNLAFILYPAFLMSMIAAVLLGLATSLLMMLAAAVFYAVGQGSITPSIQTTCIRKLGPARVGVATSTFFIGMDVGIGFGSIIGGVAADALGGFSMVFISSAGLLLLAAVALAFSSYGRIRKKAGPV